MNIINPCAYDTLVATSPHASSPYTYYISDTNNFEFSTYFNGNVSNCAITYEAFSDSGMTIPITTPPFSISSTGVLTVSSNDPTLDSTIYSIYVAAYATDNSPSSKVACLMQFYFSGCKVNTAIIPTYNNVQYLIKSS